MDAVKRLPVHSAFQPQKVTVGPDEDDGLVRMCLRDRQKTHSVYLTPPEALAVADALTQIAEPLNQALIDKEAA